MDIRKSYRMQQQYYSGFSFMSMHPIIKHNYFVYKVYAGKADLYPLFDCVLNKEVLDTYYVVAIRKALSSSSASITEAVVNDLDYARDAVALFFRETGEEHVDLAFVERNMRILKRSFENFEEVLYRLNCDLQNLLSGHDFSSAYKTNSEDIANMIDVMKQINHGMQRCMSRLGEFTAGLPIKGKYKQPASVAKYCVRNLIEGLTKWCKVQEGIIYQLQGWRTVRTSHELQELLN